MAPLMNWHGDIDRCNSRCRWPQVLLKSWFRHGRNDALLDNDPRLRRLLERLLGHPFRTNWHAQGPLVLLSGLEGMWKLGGEILFVLLGSIVSIMRPTGTYNSQSRILPCDFASR